MYVVTTTSHTTQKGKKKEVSPQSIVSSFWGIYTFFFLLFLAVRLLVLRWCNVCISIVERNEALLLLPENEGQASFPVPRFTAASGN